MTRSRIKKYGAWRRAHPDLLFKGIKNSDEIRRSSNLERLQFAKARDTKAIKDEQSKK